MAADSVTVERVLVAVAIAVIVAVVAVLVERGRRRDRPVQGTYTVPAQLVRNDFDRPDAPWLVAVFTSETCGSCEEAWGKAALLESDDVAVQRVELAERKDLHDRYAIEAVPAVLVADVEGVVRASFLGPPPAADLWAAVAALRADDPGQSTQ